MTSYIPIVPIDIVKQMTSFRVDGLLMNLFVGVNITVSIFDNTDKLIDTRSVYLSGEDYSNWNNDDQYIVNKVAEKLGFTILTPTPDPTPDPTLNSTSSNQ